LNERIGREDFETGGVQGALTSRGQEIATRVTKSGASVGADQGKTEDREQSGS